jgi:hypothetical protein
MTQRPSKEEMLGMTMNERLFAAGLTDDFDSALQRDDRLAFITVLHQVAFTEAEAVAYTQTHFESLRGRLNHRGKA